MTKIERMIEAELVTLFKSLGRCTVIDVSGEPHVQFVREFEPADADERTIYVEGINRLSLTVVAKLIATKFRSTSP